MTPSTRRGTFLIILSTACAIINYLGFEALFRAYPTLTALNVLFWGMLGASILGAPFFLRTRTTRTRLITGIRKHRLAFLGIISIMLISYEAWLIALPLIGAGPLTLISKSQTIFAVLLGILILGERLSRAQWGAVLIAGVGVVLASTLPYEMSFLGAALAWGFALSQALTSFITKRYARDVDGLVFSFSLVTATALVSGIIGLALGIVHFPGWIPFLWLSLNQALGTLVGRALYFAAHNHLPISTLNVLILAGPGITIFAAWALFGDPITVQKLFGLACISLGLAWFSRTQSIRRDMEEGIA